MKNKAAICTTKKIRTESRADFLNFFDVKKQNRNYDFLCFIKVRIPSTIKTIAKTAIAEAKIS